MALISWGVGMAVNGFGKKPVVPELPRIDAAKTQQETVAGNLAVMPQAQRLAGQVNDFNTTLQLEQLKRAMAFALPGGFERMQAIVDAQMRGEVPLDVQQQVFSSAAGRALAGGFAGSGMGRNLAARDFGLTSMAIQGQGLNTFMNLSSMFAPKQTFDVTSMFFSPQQRMELAMRERTDHFNRDLIANQVAAAPEPWKKALVDAVAADEQSIMTLVGNVAGAAAKGAAACWVARAVYGDDNPLWLVVRHWLFTRAPQEFREFYLTFGEGIAEQVKRNPKLREELRPYFDSIVRSMVGGL